MITMEFEEMKKVWDEQNQEQLYAINEAALHKNIQSKKKRASRISNINDFGLIAVAFGTIGFLWFSDDSHNWYHYVITATLLLIVAYITFGRFRRKKKELSFDRTMLGELDHAISTVEYEAKRAKTMVWWFIVPLGVPTIAVMIWKVAPLWSWFVVIGSLILSYLVIQWDLNRCHLPKKRKLEALREKLTEETGTKQHH